MPSPKFNYAPYVGTKPLELPHKLWRKATAATKFPDGHYEWKYEHSLRDTPDDTGYWFIDNSCYSKANYGGKKPLGFNAIKTGWWRYVAPLLKDVPLTPAPVTAPEARPSSHTTKSKEFWMVYSPRGTQPPRVRHSTSEGAQAAAARLADKFRNRHFYVLKSEIAYINTAPEPPQVRPTATEVGMRRGMPRTMSAAECQANGYRAAYELFRDVRQTDPFLRANDIIQPVLPPSVRLEPKQADGAITGPHLPVGEGIKTIAREVAKILLEGGLRISV